MKKTRILVFLGLLVAMDIILTHLLAFYPLPSVRLSFGFVPVSFSPIFFGPIIGGIGAMLGDIIGTVLFPTGGPYFVGFTLSALVTGVIYGLFLHKRAKSVLNILLAVLCITIFVDLGMNTYWLSIILGKGFLLLLPARIVKSLVMVPVQVAVIYAMWRYAGAFIEKNYINEKN